MKLLKTIFCGVLIAMAVSTLFAMEGPRPEIDCYNITNKDDLISLLTRHRLADAAFDVNKDWDQIPSLVNGFWKNLIDAASKKSILDCYTKISRPEKLVKASSQQKSATLCPDSPVVAPSYNAAIREWIRNNKCKSAGIGIITLGTLDALQAYVRTDKAIWKESDLKGRLELIRRKMIITRSYNGARGFIKSYCA